MGTFLALRIPKKDTRMLFMRPSYQTGVTMRLGKQMERYLQKKRANGIWKQILDEFKFPFIESKIEGDLQAFVEKRQKEGGANTNF